MGYLAEDQLLNLENKKFDVEYRIKVHMSQILKLKKVRILKQKKKFNLMKMN